MFRIKPFHTRTNSILNKAYNSLYVKRSLCETSTYKIMRNVPPPMEISLSQDSDHLEACFFYKFVQVENYFELNILESKMAA